MSVPLYVVVLDKLEEQILGRIDAYHAQTDKGITQDQYMKHVGMISECRKLLDEIAVLRKQLREDEDLDETGDRRNVRKQKRRSV